MRLASTLALLVPFSVVACNDPAAPTRPASIVANSATTQDAPVGGVVALAPSVRVATASGRAVAGITVRFQVADGGGRVSGAEAVTDAGGVATVVSWTLGAEPGLNTLSATVAELPGRSVLFEATALPEGCAALTSLDLPIGAFLRLKGAVTTSLPCLLFDPDVAAGHEYLLLLENMPPTGGFEAGLFPGAPSGAAITYTVRGLPLGTSAAPPAALVQLSAAYEPDHEHAWDFGAGRIRELRPETPPGGVAAPRLLRDGRAVDLNRLTADPLVGDTIEVRLEGLPRLSIPTGNQKAVIRHITPHIIIAEDVRLATSLPRQSGGFNTPLTEVELTAIAAEYTNNARIQGDLLFENRHNTAVEEVPPNRVIAVHSLMPSDDIWGYTYSSTNYFVWDYWVATDGFTKGLNQHPHRVADNLFMHEVAHMRHWGMLQRSGSPPRGNRWLVEGFARFSERLPIAARLLGSSDPSRIANVVLPLNPDFNNAYFTDDVPTYGSASAGMFFGYQTSAFVFDYFADQVSLQGGDWRLALRELVVAAGAQATLDAVVQRWLAPAPSRRARRRDSARGSSLPGNTFADLFTRARIALYMDDIGIQGLPAWTQYHQFQLRQSRALPEQLANQDPRVAWPRISPASTTAFASTLGAGAAVGFIIDGALGSSTALFSFEAPVTSSVLLTLVRIR
jgi:hypothetical protein